jgi:hypothetical protein
MLELIVTWWALFRQEQKEVGLWSEMVPYFKLNSGTGSNFTWAEPNKFSKFGLFGPHDTYCHGVTRHALPLEGGDRTSKMSAVQLTY